MSSPTDLREVVAYVNMHLNDLQDEVTSGSHSLPNGEIIYLITDSL